MKHLLALLIASCLAWPAAATGPADAEWNLTLNQFMGASQRKGKPVSKDLNVTLNVRDSEVTAGAGRARQYNRSAHVLDEAVVHLDDDTFSGQIKVTISPDRWVPKDGAFNTVHAQIAGKFEPVPDQPDQWQIDGRYAGVGPDGEKVTGKLTGTVTPRRPLTDARLFGRCYPAPIDGKDSPELEFALGVVEGKVAWCEVGKTWNRWPHRFTDLPIDGLRWDDSTRLLTGTIPVAARDIDVAAAADATWQMHVRGAAVGGQFVVKLEVDRGDGLRRSYVGGDLVAWGSGARHREPDDYLTMYESDRSAWFTAVPDFVPPAAGEHPRLLFRRADLPALRAKAQTPEGQAILARLRKLLAEGGEGLPTRFNKTPPHNHDHSPKKQPVGETFTSWHAAGYGLLYALTEDQKYADLSRQCAQWMLDGKIDRDNRYAFARPGNAFRAGSLLGAMALAYDLSYDGWPEAFRKQVAQVLQDYDYATAGGKPLSVDHILGETGYPPASNHYGAHLGGATLAQLAILGDPGVDNDLVRRRIAHGEWMLAHFFTYGMGDRGWYAEGPHPSRIAVNTGASELIPALANVLGRDYRTRDAVQWAGLRWVMWLRGGTGHPSFDNRGTYGSDQLYARGPMLSHGGDIAYAFAVTDPEYHPAIKWTYEQRVRPWEVGQSKPWWADGQPMFNAHAYPHRAIYAFVFWPVAAEPANPQTVMPKVAMDAHHDFIVARNGWQGSDDIIFTFSGGVGPWGYHRPKSRGNLHINAYGHSIGVPLRGQQKAIHFAAADDGSFSATHMGFHFQRQTAAMAVDLSGAAGADLVLVMAGQGLRGKSLDAFLQKQGKPADPKRPTIEKRAADRGIVLTQALDQQTGVPLYVLTVDKTRSPQVAFGADGTVTVGGVVYSWYAEQINFPAVNP